MYTLTNEQNEILSFVKSSIKNLIVSANPGTGKSFSIARIAENNPDKTFLILAFMKNAKDFPVPGFAETIKLPFEDFTKLRIATCSFVSV